MNNSITIYNQKQPVIIHTSNEGEIWVTDIDTHNKKDIAKIASNVLNIPIKTKEVSIEGQRAKVIYNDGCRYIDFTLGFKKIL